MEGGSAAIIPLRLVGPYAVLEAHLVGSFDPESAERIAAVIVPQLPLLPPGSVLAFDCSQLTFLNSKTIGMLITWHLQLKERQVRTVLIAPRAQVLDVLTATGVLQLFPSGPSLNAVLALIAPSA